LLSGRELRRQLDHPVSDVGDPVVMGGDNDHAAGSGQLPQEHQNAFDLDVVEVGGGLVGHHQRRVVHQSTGDGHPLLLATRHLARPVGDPFGEGNPRQQRVGSFGRLFAPHAGQPVGA
jgi:hypothetical protein